MPSTLQMVRLADVPTGIPVGTYLMPYKKSKQFRYEHSLVQCSTPACISELWRLVEILRSKKLNLLDRGYDYHPMGGKWSGWTNCHIEGDLVFLFKYETVNTIEHLLMGRLGSHSYLGI